MATRTTPETPRGMQPPDRKPVRITVPEGQKARYGDPFFPKVPFQAIFYIAAVFAALLILALTSPAPLANPADPLNHEAIDPKPEWYFMFLFQLLKYFPGSYIIVGTAVIPGILTTLLLLLPFYDRNWARKVTKRPVAVVSMTGAMLAIIFLTWGGLGFPGPSFSTTSQTASPPSSGGGNGGGVSNAGAISSDVAAIFTAHCAACHLNGVASGGLNLSNYASLIKGGAVVSGSVIKPGDHAASILYQIVQPKAPWPAGARMPLGGPYLSDAQIKTISDWIDGLGKRENGGVPAATGSGGPNTGGAAASPTTKAVTSGGGGGGAASGGASADPSFKADIATIFTAHCAACHLNGVASGGLDLTYDGIMKGGNIVSGSAVKAGDHAHSVLWQIIQPGSAQPGGARMPLGGPYLSDAQIQTIANWIDKGAKNN